MAEPVTKPDMLAVKADVLAAKDELRALRSEVLAAFAAFETRLDANTENLCLRLTIRWSVIAAASAATLAIIIKLF